MDKKRKTVGLIQTELSSQAINDTHSSYDQMKEQLKEYEANMIHAIKEGKSQFNENFYIVVITKRERLMDRVLRNYFIPRQSCPTPQYDEAVYKYHFKEDRPEFLWVIPDKKTCSEFVNYPLDVPEEEYELRDYVLKFTSGELDQLAMKLNGEITTKSY